MNVSLGYIIVALLLSVQTLLGAMNVTAVKVSMVMEETVSVSFIVNPRRKRSEGYSSLLRLLVCLSVCLSHSGLKIGYLKCYAGSIFDVKGTYTVRSLKKPFVQKLSTIKRLSPYVL